MAINRNIKIKKGMHATKNRIMNRRIKIENRIDLEEMGSTMGSSRIDQLRQLLKAKKVEEVDAQNARQCLLLHTGISYRDCRERRAAVFEPRRAQHAFKYLAA